MILSSLPMNEGISARSVLSILNRLMRKGEVIRKDGNYFIAGPSKQKFFATPDKQTRELYSQLVAEFPFSKICIWRTDIIIPLMHDIPNGTMTIVSIDKNATDSAIDRLENMTDKMVLADTDGKVLTRLSSGRDIIVVSSLVSQAPIDCIDGINVPTIEKILVDIISDNSLHAMAESQAYDIYMTAFERYAINRKSLLRYAGRRNRKSEVESILNEIGR